MENQSKFEKELAKIDKNLLSSEEEISRFKEKHLVWKDMEMFIQEWLHGIKQALTMPEKVNTLQELADFQGRAHMCELFLDLPDRMIRVLEEDKLVKQLQEDRTNGNNKDK